MENQLWALIANADQKTIKIFFSIWVIFVGAFSALGLFILWRNLIADEKQGKTDKGLLWLSLSLMIWVIGGISILISLLVTEAADGAAKEDAPKWPTIIIAAISILNGVFILLSFPYFRHKPTYIKVALDSPLYPVAVWILGGVVFWLIPVSLVISGTAEDEAIYVFDTVFAVFTLGFLGYMLHHTFQKRRIRHLGSLAIVVLVITIIAQALKIGGEPVAFYRYLTAAVYMSLLVMLFFALAYSWLKEKGEKIAINGLIIDPKDIFLEILPVEKASFSPSPEEAGKNRSSREKFYYIYLTIPNFFNNRKIDFTKNSGSFGHLLEFARLRVTKENNGLNSNTQKTQKDRIVKKLLPDNHDKYLYSSEDPKDREKELFDVLNKALFETATEANISGNGYRLRIPAENITSILDMKTEAPPFIAELLKQDKESE